MNQGLSPYEAEVLTRSRLVRSGQPVGPPLSVTFSVTTRCNAACVYCNSRQRSAYHEPSFDAITLVLAQLKIAGVQHISLTGGEPLLRSDLVDIVRIASEFAPITSITTNGLLLTRELLSDLTAAGLTAVVLSIDTLDRDVQLRLRPLNFTRLLDAVTVISEQAKENRGFIPSINCVICRPTLAGILELTNSLNAQGVGVGFQPFHTRTPGSTYDEHLEILPSQYPQLRYVLDQLIALPRERLIMNSAAFLDGIYQFVTTPTATRTCLNSMFNLSIDANLMVRACWPDPPIGSLRTRALKDIWESERYQRLRLRHLVTGCNRCYLRCHLDIPLPLRFPDRRLELSQE